MFERESNGLSSLLANPTMVRLQSALSAHQAIEVNEEGLRRAAVALILRAIDDQFRGRAGLLDSVWLTGTHRGMARGHGLRARDSDQRASLPARRSRHLGND